MFPWEVLKGSTFSLSGVRSPNLTGITTTALVKFVDGTTSALTVTLVNPSAGTYTISSATSSWIVGPCTLEVTYTNSSGGGQTQKFAFNCVDPSATSTQTSLVNNDTKIIVSTR